MRRLGRLSILGLGALALAGCTLVPTSSAPVAIARQRVPFGLLNRTIPNTNGARVRFATQPVYIVDALGHLAPSSRIVPSPPTLVSVLRELVLGPTTIETYAGYSSALPKSVVVLDASIEHDVAIVDLAKPLSALSRRDQVLAVGEIVLTAHDVTATRALEVRVDGVVQSLWLPNGRRATAVTVEDYASLLGS